MTNNNIKSWIGEGLKAANSWNFNIINILRTIIEDDNCVCYIPLSYTKERETNPDPRVHFNPIEAGKTIIATGIQSNQERFNFSITGSVDVYVEYENEDESIELVPKKVFRTYTIIRDGKPTIDYIVAKLSEDTFNNLRSVGVLYYNGQKVLKNHKYIPTCLYKIMLKDVPVISLAWAQPTQIGLYDNLVKENHYANTLKELNKKIKEYKDIYPAPTFNVSDDYYTEQYNGETKIKTGEKVNCVVYKVKDDKQVVQEYLDRAINLEQAIIEKSKVNSILKKIRFINRCVIWAIETSKEKGSYNWSELELIPRSKEKYRQTCKVILNDKDIELIREEYKMEI